MSRDIAKHYQTRVYDEALKLVSPSVMYSESLVCNVCFKMYSVIDKKRQSMIWASFSNKIKEKVREGHAYASDDVLRQAIRLSSASTMKIPLLIGTGDKKVTNLKSQPTSIPSKPRKLLADVWLGKENRPHLAELRPMPDPHNLLGIDDSNLKRRAKKLLQSSRVLQAINDGIPVDADDPSLEMAFSMQGSKAFTRNGFLSSLYS